MTFSLENHFEAVVLDSTDSLLDDGEVVMFFHQPENKLRETVRQLSQYISSCTSLEILQCSVPLTKHT